MSDAKIICPECGTEMPEEAAFCPKCGAAYVELPSLSEEPAQWDIPSFDAMAKMAGMSEEKIRSMETAAQEPALQQQAAQTQQFQQPLSQQDYEPPREMPVEEKPVWTKPGVVPENPILLDLDVEEWTYLYSLKSSIGEKVEWSFLGTIYVPSVGGEVNVYVASLPSGREYRRVYLRRTENPGAMIAPEGFLFGENKPFVEERPQRNYGKIIAWILIAAIVIGAMVYLLSRPTEEERNYQQAKEYLEQGEYFNAVSAFQELGDYKDSEDLLKEALYMRAKAYLEQGDYALAYGEFDALNDYEDSREMCKEVRYQEAIYMINSGEYTLAVAQLEKLGAYKESYDKIDEAKYGYVLDHRSNTDYTTYQYLQELVAKSYKNSSTIYNELYTWRVTVLAVNSDKDDTTTNKTSIYRNNPLYIHIQLDGGTPGETLTLTMKYTLPSGYYNSYRFNSAWSGNSSDGSVYWENGVGGSAGTLYFSFYDEDNNKIGSGSVYIS